MSEKVELVTEIVTALKELGGSASLEDIYRKIKQRNKIDLTVYKDWHSRVRTTIYDHSSDTERFNDKKPNLFTSVKGKGKGEWSLKD